MVRFINTIFKRIMGNLSSACAAGTEQALTSAHLFPMWFSEYFKPTLEGRKRTAFKMSLLAVYRVTRRHTMRLTLFL